MGSYSPSITELVGSRRSCKRSCLLPGDASTLCDGEVSEDDVHLVVHKMSGTDALEMFVKKDAAISTIKRMIADKWSIHPAWQTLVLGVVKLLDSDLIGDHCADVDSDARLTLIVSLDSVYSDLGSQDAMVRLKAVKALACSPIEYSDLVINALQGCLEDCWVVREEAAEILAKLGEIQVREDWAPRSIGRPVW